MITLKKFPLIEYFSTPTGPLAVANKFSTQTKTARAYLDSTPAVSDFFDQIAMRHQHKSNGTNRNYLVDRYLWRKLSEDYDFRSFYMMDFLENAMAPGMGTLLYGDGGQLGYVFLSEEDTLRFKHRKGRYLAAIAATQNTFTGFEEAFIADERIEYINGGFFSPPLNIPVLLQITGAFLAYLSDLDEPQAVKNDVNQTGQLILHVI